MKRFNDLVREVTGKDEATVAVELLHSGPEGQLDIVSGVVCLIDDNDLVSAPRGQGDGGSKLPDTIPHSVQKTTLVGPVDDNVRGTDLVTQCLGNGSLANACRSSKQQVRNLSLFYKPVERLFNILGKNTFSNLAGTILFNPKKFFHNQGSRAI
jgi:hypothetical protein